MKMENTIENAMAHLLRYRDERTTPVSTDYFAELMLDYTTKVISSKNRHIAELEKQVEELGGQSILDTLLRNKGLREDLVLSADAIGLLQHDNARLEKENTDLRRAISECKAKARIGISPENR